MTAMYLKYRGRPAAGPVADDADRAGVDGAGSADRRLARRLAAGHHAILSRPSPARRADGTDPGHHGGRIAREHHLLWTREHLAALRAQADAEHARAEQQAREAELRMLRAQLEPHMLFNTLANLRALIAVDAAAAQTMLDRLIAFLRATLTASRRDRVPLRDELA